MERERGRGRGRAGKPRPTQGHLRFSLSHCLIRVTSAFVRSFVGSLRSLRRNARSPSVVRLRPRVRRIARRGVCVWLASHPSLQAPTAQRNRADAVGREQENHGKPEIGSSVEHKLQAASSSWEDFSSLSVKLAGDAHVVRRHASTSKWRSGLGWNGKDRRKSHTGHMASTLFRVTEGSTGVLQR